MEIIALLVIQLIATAAAFALIWRKLDQVGADVARIKRMLETLELMRFSSGAQKRSQPTRAEPALTPAGNDLPAPPPRTEHDDPFSTAWVRPGARVPREESLTPTRPALPLRGPASRQVMANDMAEDLPPAWRANVSPETGRLIAAAAMSLAPAIGFAIGAPAAALIACGLSLGGALMLVALRPMWRAAAFVGVLCAGGWAVTAFALDAAQASPAVFSIFAALAGVAGLVHARLRSMAPGATMVLLMGGALLALGDSIGLAGPTGLSYGALAAAAAIAGAISTRIQGLHLCAFAAAMAGLFAFSGQAPAAIWFTPITAWMGALFFAIAAIRAPALGARGAVLTATGVTAPLLSAGALSLSQHGLANPLAAAGAFLSLAVMFGALIAVAAQRFDRGVQALKLTAWVLLGGSLIAYVTATLLGLLAPFAVTALAGAALGLAAFDRYRSQRLWRAGAVALFAAAAVVAWVVLRNGWPDALVLAAMLVAPALFASGAAYISQRGGSVGATAVFESAAILGGAASAIALVRLVFSGGAPNEMPIGFVEAGAHLAVWAGAALALAFRSEHGAQLVRRASSALFGTAALSGAAIAGLLWLTPFWSERPASGIDLSVFQHAPLGFALPAILAWAHWAFWRQRGVHMRTRVSLAAAALLTAAFVALEVLSAREEATAGGQLDWISVAAVLVAFALAVGVNFAPGVTDEIRARSRFDKYFQRYRRREQRT